MLEPFGFVLTNQLRAFTAGVIRWDVTEMVIMKLDVLLEMLSACEADVEYLVRLIRASLRQYTISGRFSLSVPWDDTLLIGASTLFPIKPYRRGPSRGAGSVRKAFQIFKH